MVKTDLMRILLRPSPVASSFCHMLEASERPKIQQLQSKPRKQFREEAIEYTNILLIYRYKNAKGRSTTTWYCNYIHCIWLVNAMPCTSHALPSCCQRSLGLPRWRSSPGFASELRNQCDILGCWYLERQRRIWIWDWYLEDLNDVRRSF